MTLIKNLTLLPFVLILLVAAPLSAGTAAAASATRSPTETATTTEKPDGLFAMLFGKRPSATPVASSDAGSGRTSPRPALALAKAIAVHAEAAGLPAELAEAVIRRESRFNPKARGSHGEIGLMQIKPATARAIGYRGSAAGLYDVETNLTWGMAYLAGAYRLAGGDTCGTVLRYNAGHGARRMTRQARDYCADVNSYVASL